jgi:hypothetical protein
MKALKDILIFIGLWFIGRADRIKMAEQLEEIGKAIKRNEQENN